MATLPYPLIIAAPEASSSGGHVTIHPQTWLRGSGKLSLAWPHEGQPRQPCEQSCRSENLGILMEMKDLFFSP